MISFVRCCQHARRWENLALTMMLPKCGVSVSVSGGAGVVSAVLWWQAERGEYYSRVWYGYGYRYGYGYQGFIHWVVSTLPNDK